MTNTYPQRLIEVDLPIKRISAHARREKSIRHGHISTLHIWWARRPLAACRAVICASLWPDPADPLCPPTFRRAAADAMVAFAKAVLADSKATETCDPESWKRYGELAKRQTPLDLVTLPKPRRNGDPPPATPADLELLRVLLLDFIADFAAWEASTQKIFLSTARALTQAAHESLGGAPGTRPLVVDPFAGGGSIPLEALRVGADAFASDLNPVAVLLNKVVLEYIPKYGQQLADEVRKWGQWVKERAEKELSEYYPKDPDGATPIAYLWARTIQCEGPNCGAVIPLLHQTFVSRRRNHAVVVKISVNKETREIALSLEDSLEIDGLGVGTVQNGCVTCPACGTTMKPARYRRIASDEGLGERLFGVVLRSESGKGRAYRTANKMDEEVFEIAALRLAQIGHPPADTPSLAPSEKIGYDEPRRLNVLHYGFKEWGHLFNRRQQLALLTLAKALRACYDRSVETTQDKGLIVATGTILSLAISNIAQYNSNVSTWLSDGIVSAFIQSSSLPMRSDYAEANPLTPTLAGGISFQLGKIAQIFGSGIVPLGDCGVAQQGSATAPRVPEGSVDAVVTDPPYYFAIPYADLSDFFYVWLKRLAGYLHPDLLSGELTPKEEEAVQSLPHSRSTSKKDRLHFEVQLARSMASCRSSLGPNGIAIIVFAHASTEAWESLLGAIVDAGLTVTGSWPIDTERAARMLASRQRVLASSVHLACRPRMGDPIGDWRTVLQELPQRIHQWMPRLEAEGVVGADAIFACLGPALEIFSRYSRVEKANGEKVTLREYLEHVWAAVAQEALRLVFSGADAGALEADARLTAIWLWTMGVGNKDEGDGGQVTGDSNDDDGEGEVAPEGNEDGAGKVVAGKTGYTLEYDAARKIAQGLGANLEQMADVVEVKGDKARLLTVAERTRILFGKDEGQVPQKARKKARQANLFASIDELENEDGGWGDKSVPKLGHTVLDRVHQSMILFAAGRGEAVKRFLVEEGAGRDGKFWKLAQSLSALYPVGTDEKRWVDGVLARKKGLGL